MAIRDYIEKTAKNAGAKVILVPSLDDMYSLFPFPQPPLSDKHTENVCFLPNPAQFTVNGVTFGIVNIDVVRKMMSSSYNTIKTQHRVISTLQALAEQRSFYPLYPPDEDHSVDYSQFERFQFETVPDVMVTMSALPVFTELIDGKFVVVNPGKAAKMNSTGTYAVIMVNSDHEAKELSDKVTVEIRNL